MTEQPRAIHPQYGLQPTGIEGFDLLAELALDMRSSWNHATDVIWRQLDEARANAYGLMQLLPSVGKKMAHEEGITSFQTFQLLDPAMNIRLGTRYLRQTLDHFGGVQEYALAAYDAGDNRVADWQAAGPYSGIDEFVESIPFTETREYVEAILATRRPTGRSTILPAPTAPQPQQHLASRTWAPDRGNPTCNCRASIRIDFLARPGKTVLNRMHASNTVFRSLLF